MFCYYVYDRPTTQRRKAVDWIKVLFSTLDAFMASLNWLSEAHKMPDLVASYLLWYCVILLANFSAQILLVQFILLTHQEMAHVPGQSMWLPICWVTGSIEKVTWCHCCLLGKSINLAAWVYLEGRMWLFTAGWNCCWKNICSYMQE